MFAHEFVRNAYLAGTFTAVACGTVGWFVVLRAQVFAGDALSHVAFTGAVAAAAIGIDARLGLFAATLAVGAGMAALHRRGPADDAAIGTMFSWILGLGILFVSLASTGTGISTANTLFGSIFGLDASQADVAALIGAAAVLVLMVISRPLLFATVDPLVARVSGVPTQALGVGLLLLLAVVAAEATQAVGALLLLGLIAAPAGAASRLTHSPWLGLALSAAIALTSMWAGLALSYVVAPLPPSSAVTLLAASFYLATFAVCPPSRRTSRSIFARSEL